MNAKPSLKSIKTRRRLVQVSREELVQESFFSGTQTLPVILKPVVSGLSLTTWARQNCGSQRPVGDHRIFSLLHAHGGILFRGFQIQGAADFGAFIEAISQAPMTYSYRSTPRTQVEEKVYTSTEYPADRSIPLHNEMAYARQWPMTLAFYCEQPATEQGETPIADSRRVLSHIPVELQAKFAERGVLYVRNYGSGLDLPWQEVFQTEHRQEVESYCQQANIDYEWWGQDQLRTRQICDAIATHPQTQETIWFNQAHLFHISNLGDSHEQLATTLSQAHWPRNAYFGDGSEIPQEVLTTIRDAYTQETILFPWQTGDVLLLDNMLTAHGRRPFKGVRRVLAGMADPHSSDPISMPHSQQEKP